MGLFDLLPQTAQHYPDAAHVHWLAESSGSDIAGQSRTNLSGLVVHYWGKDSLWLTGTVRKPCTLDIGVQLPSADCTSVFAGRKISLLERVACESFFSGMHGCHSRLCPTCGVSILRCFFFVMGITTEACTFWYFTYVTDMQIMITCCVCRLLCHILRAAITVSVFHLDVCFPDNLLYTNTCTHSK